jgi:hypothetical protein
MKGILLFFRILSVLSTKMTDLMKAVLLCVAVQAAFATMPARFGSLLLYYLRAFTHAYSFAPLGDEMTFMLTKFVPICVSR